jgi:hypothetical protein
MAYNHDSSPSAKNEKQVKENATAILPAPLPVHSIFPEDLQVKGFTFQKILFRFIK